MLHTRIVAGIALVCLAVPTFARAQEKDMVVEGQVKAGVHKLKLEANTLYQIEVKAKNFNPNVSLFGWFVANTVPFGKEQNTFRGVFLPPKAGDYTVYVLPNISFQPQDGLLDYTFTLKTKPLNETPILKKEDKLTADDPKYANKGAFNVKTHHKTYPLKMAAGKTYIIDMIQAKTVNNKLQPYLFLEGANNSILMRDSNGGGYPNARIIFTATADGEHTIIASGAFDNGAIGDYLLTVRTLKDEK